MKIRVDSLVAALSNVLKENPDATVSLSSIEKTLNITSGAVHAEVVRLIAAREGRETLSAPWKPGTLLYAFYHNETATPGGFEIDGLPAPMKRKFFKLICDERPAKINGMQITIANSIIGITAWVNDRYVQAEFRYIGPRSDVK